MIIINKEYRFNIVKIYSIYINSVEIIFNLFNILKEYKNIFLLKEVN